MPVRVDVVESEPGCLKGAELGVDLGPHLRPNRRPRADLKPEPCEVLAQASVRVDEIGQLFGGQRRLAVDEDEMQADAKTREPARARDCVCRGRCSDHQACGGQDALLMRQFHGCVNLGREPEIVGRDDKVLQSATSRSRRNLKNSTPSRSRRFIISGLRTISPTIEAIFGARK